MKTPPFRYHHPKTVSETIAVVGPKGQREVPFADFPVAYMTPAIEPNELVVGVRYPQWAAKHGYAFVEFSRRHGDFAITSAAVLIEGDASGKITRASVTIGGLGTAPRRARDVEQAIVGQVPAGTLFRDACESCRKLDAIDDVHAPASYRQHLAAGAPRRGFGEGARPLRRRTRGATPETPAVEGA